MLNDREIEEDQLQDLSRRMDAALGTKTSLYHACHDVFHRLDKTYNGSIFAYRSDLDEIVVETAVLRSIFQELQPVRAVYTFASMPVEIIGHAYEDFLSKEIVTTDQVMTVEPKPENRRRHGVYYTPRTIVDSMITSTLGPILPLGKIPDCWSSLVSSKLRLRTSS